MKKNESGKITKKTKQFKITLSQDVISERQNHLNDVGVKRTIIMEGVIKLDNIYSPIMPVRNIEARDLLPACNTDNWKIIKAEEEK